MNPGTRVFDSARRLGTVVGEHEQAPGGFVLVQWDRFKDEEWYLTHVRDLWEVEDGYHRICPECGGVFATTRQRVMRVHGPRNNPCPGSGQTPDAAPVDNGSGKP